MVSERCDEKRSSSTGRSTEIREIQYKESAPERVPAPVPKDPVRRSHTPETPTKRISFRNQNFRPVLPDRESSSQCDHRIVPASHVTITRNVTIGKGYIIGANSIVTHIILPNRVAAENPARVIRSRN